MSVFVDVDLHTIAVLFCHQVGVPYLRAKAHDYYEELGGGINSDVLEDGVGTRQLQVLSDQVCLVAKTL